MYWNHLYAQLGCLAFEDSIQVSSHPVAPSFGITEATGAFAPRRVLSMTGHDAPSVDPPLLNRSTWSETVAQYFLISAFCFLSRLTAAPSCALVNSYGSVIPSDGLVFDRYSA